MEQELISKKELLELYDISYGALYRWKRKGLIPEDWFIKKSTVTGQETFFPRDLISERIELIKAQKDDISLDELSKRLSTQAKKNAAMILETELGKRTFYLKDIKSIVIDDGNGIIINITDDIKGEHK
jgi:DNA-binding transcriptional MerR regulator